jgi:ketosteroid isomerase-like protein
MSANRVSPTRRSELWRIARRLFATAGIAAVLLGTAACGHKDPPNDPQDDAKAQIRQAIDKYYDALNTSDFATLKAVLCPGAGSMLDGVNENAFRTANEAIVKKEGTIRADTFEDIKITQERAEVTFTYHHDGLQAQVRGVGDERAKAQMGLTDGTWKICKEPQDDATTATKKEQAATRDEVRDALKTLFKTWATGTRETLLPLLCGDLLTEITGLDDADFKVLQARFASIEITTTGVTVNGDQAVATVADTGGPPDSIFKLTRDAKHWKVCGLV